MYTCFSICKGLNHCQHHCGVLVFEVSGARAVLGARDHTIGHMKAVWVDEVVNMAFCTRLL